MIRLFIYVGLTVLCSCKPTNEERIPVTNTPTDSTIKAFPASDFPETDSQVVLKISEEQSPRTACHPKAQADTIKNASNRLKITDILKELDTKLFQEYKITGSNDTTIVLQEGTKVKIPSNAFIIQKSGQRAAAKVSLLVKEYYSLCDIYWLA